MTTEALSSHTRLFESFSQTARRVTLCASVGMLSRHIGIGLLWQCNVYECDDMQGKKQGKKQGSTPYSGQDETGSELSPLALASFGLATD